MKISSKKEVIVKEKLDEGNINEISNIASKIIHKLYAIKNYQIHLLLAATLVAIGFAYYFYNEASVLKKDPDKVAREETESIISRVSKLIVLPEEIPTMATVLDPAKLVDQPFFTKAKTGDRVLIYVKAKRAILYDPIANKIVEIAPLNIGNE